MLKAILSPAKKLNLLNEAVSEKNMPVFIKEAKKIHSVLKRQSPQDLMKLMNLSTELSDLNWHRNQQWTGEGKYSAALAFDGEVYKGLSAKQMSVEQLKTAQEKLYILSGLYGLLKPLDIIEPYRLEMGTKFAIDEKKNLYEFWQKKITEQINKELKNGILVNLASEEYFKTIDKKALKARVITCQFKDYKDGKLKTVMVYAKKTRGKMARFIVENKIENAVELKNFTYDHYAFDDNLSSETHWVFTR